MLLKNEFKGERNFMDAELTRAFPDLSESEALFATAKMQAAFLQETEKLLDDFDNKGHAEKIYGLKEDIQSALELAQKNLAATLQKVSETELQHLRNEKIITEKDFTEAVKTKRKRELERGSDSKQKLER